MKRSCLAIVTLALLSACSQSPSPRTIESSAIADEFCAGNYKPWRVVLSACNAETNAGTPGQQCDFYNQIGLELDRRSQASGQKTCQLIVDWRTPDSAKR